MDDVGASRLGRTVKKYRLDRIIGSGGMAIVYEATHRNGHRVALKMLKPSLSIGADVRTRFQREGYAANKVRHPGAVRIIDDDVTDDGLVFLVMELLEGSTLDALAKANGGKLSVRTAIEVGKQLLDVLAVAHEAGIVHRDIKPENVLVQRDGSVKVLDFGIARVHDAAGATGTMTGRMLGTPAFMPPEQAYGRRAEVDGRSDLWAVGATLFAVLAGRVVHVATTAEETLIRAATEPAPPLGSVVDGVPAAVAAVIDKSLSVERSARWQSAHEMSAALERAHEESFQLPIFPRVGDVGSLEVGPSSPRMAPPASRIRRSAVGAGIAGLALTLVASWSGHRAAASDVSANTLTSHSIASAVERIEPPSAQPVEPSVPSPAPVESTIAAPAVSATKIRAARHVIPAPQAHPSASASPAPTASSCGFDIDEEGRRWPKRCR